MVAVAEVEEAVFSGCRLPNESEISALWPLLLSVLLQECVYSKGCVVCDFTTTGPRMALGGLLRSHNNSSSSNDHNSCIEPRERGEMFISGFNRAQATLYTRRAVALCSTERERSS